MANVVSKPKKSNCFKKNCAVSRETVCVCVYKTYFNLKKTIFSLNSAVNHFTPLCLLFHFAFTWAHKQPRKITWCGLLCLIFSGKHFFFVCLWKKNPSRMSLMLKNILHQINFLNYFLRIPRMHFDARNYMHTETLTTNYTQRLCNFVVMCLVWKLFAIISLVTFHQDAVFCNIFLYLGI